MMGERTYEPDWSEWLLIAEMTVEDAVALTLNFDPDKRTDWEKNASAAQRAEFDRRLYWLNKLPLRPIGFFREPLIGCVDAGGFGPIVFVDIRKFYFPEVVHYAKEARWELPVPLLRLIPVGSGDGSKASLPSAALERYVDTRIPS